MLGLRAFAACRIVEMCDSSISESCLGDFSQYCPFNNQPRLPGDRKSTIRKRIALFSKADSQHHLYSVSQPILQQSHVSREDIEATPKSYGGGRGSHSMYMGGVMYITAEFMAIRPRAN